MHRQDQQGDGDDPAQQRGPHAEKDHDGEPEGAVDDGRHAAQHVKGEAAQGNESRIGPGIDVQVQRHRQAEQDGQEGRAAGQIQRTDDGVQDPASLAQIIAPLWESG